MRKLALAFTLLASTAMAGGDHIEIGHGWMAETDEDHARVYFNIHNETDSEVVLVGIKTDAAAEAHLTAPSLKAGGERLELENFPILAEASLEMEPEGVYIELHELNGHMHEGDHFDMVLIFEPGGAMEVEVDVEGADAESVSHAGHNH